MKRKWIFALGVVLFLLGGCSPEPEFIDDGRHGSIYVKVFNDENRNGIVDEGEAGVIERIGISQDISCPAGSLDALSILHSDIDGEARFTQLKPGIYCVQYLGSESTTTRIAVKVGVSSGQVAEIGFGVNE